MTLPIISSGVVCPGGFGSGALRERWRTTRVSDASKSCDYDVLQVDRDAPELRRWEREPRLRRASPISYYLVEAASQALEQAPHIDRGRVGVVGAFFLGCLVYTVRFYRQITSEGRRSASPVIFPETVFNSPLSHLVSVLGLGGPVYSQVGDTSCWSSALRTAQTWLARGTADHVLVIGAEEFESHQLDAFRAGGLFRQPLNVADGAGAVLLGRDDTAAIAGIREVHDGFSYGNSAQAAEAARQCLECVSPNCPVMETASGGMAPIAERASADRRNLSHSAGKIPEAATASGAWNTILAAETISGGSEREIAVPFWGLSQQCGLAICAALGAVKQP
ncbi:beta-ketoacyl synthase N-terminal-like domain-containing protein [Bradyrhizobium sp.]|uniref:beta-ketoacyl synthase N-terminal-like domain-containing protein n=1 Tax=Bradyrhizobium sp. TaxID=376 RepID=UPI0025BEAE2A|nr:beta-ketoacyl synthase N-terminal-like domain-containing protein [Bradyrhizobium sp.]